jgi:hypothetical protein
VLGRFHTHPDWPVNRILDEYYDAFGKASQEVRAYFAYWEKVSEEFSNEHSRADSQTGFVTENDSGARLGYRNPLWNLARRMFTSAEMAEARKLLGAAQRAAEGDPVAKKRVAFLETGLTHAELTMAVACAHADHQRTSKQPINSPYADNYAKVGERYKHALDALVEFRKRTALECPNFSNVGWLTFQEWAANWAHLRPWDPKTPQRYR